MSGDGIFCVARRESGGQCDFSPPVFPVDARREREPREMRKVGYQSALWVFLSFLGVCALFRSFCFSRPRAAALEVRSSHDAATCAGRTGRPPRRPRGAAARRAARARGGESAAPLARQGHGAYAPVEVAPINYAACIFPHYTRPLQFTTALLCAVPLPSHTQPRTCTQR